MTSNHLSSMSLQWTRPCSVWEIVCAPMVTLSTWTGGHCSWRGFISLWDKRHVPLPPHARCHVPLRLMNGGIVLLHGQTPILFSVSSSQWQTLCHSAPEFHSFSLLKKMCEKSFLLPGHSIVASGLSLPDGSLLLTLGLQKDWIDGGFLTTAHCPNNARHLKFTKHLPSHGLTHSHQDTGPARDGSK